MMQLVVEVTLDYEGRLNAETVQKEIESALFESDSLDGEIQQSIMKVEVKKR